MHIGNYAPIAVIAFFIIANLWKRFSTATVRAEAKAAAPPPAAPRVTAPAPRPAAAKPAAVLPLRRRLPQQSVPILPPVATAPPPRAPLPAPVLPPGRAVADAYPAEAAGAFAGLDLSLPDAGAPAVFAARPARRTIGSAAVLGSRGWGAGAIVAMEVLGPPVAVRPGATLGASHAL
jgi:hypothetical protein